MFQTAWTSLRIWKARGRKTRRTLSGRSALVGLLLTVGAVACVTAGEDAPAPRLIGRSTVFAHPSSDPYDRGNHYGFNHAPSVVALPDGRLLAAWFSGPFEASVDQVILGSFSTDGGVTWDPARVLQDVPRDSDFDPAFISDGKRVWFFYTAGRHNRYPAVKNQDEHVGLNSFKLFCRTSDDSAASWSEPRLLARAQFCRSNGIRLSTGELILPLYEIPSRASVLRSADGGQTWDRHGAIVTPAGAGEPSVVELGPGRLLMVLRTSDGFLWKVRSEDGGRTWGPPVKTGVVAPTSSHCVYNLGHGLLALAHNPSSARTPLTLRVSRDEGETWGPGVKLAEVVTPAPGDEIWGREVSYPSIAVNRDGRVVVVWAHLTDFGWRTIR